MLLYGGIGLLLGGLIILLFGNKIIKDPEKAANSRKQAPILMGVGAVFLVIRFVIAGTAGI